MTKTKRLLIVDDEETLTFSLYQTFIIAKNDFEVVTAASAEEALDKIIEKPFDLVLSDISMPGMSGLKLLENVKKTHPETDFIIMTAFGNDEKREEALALGAVFYIEKPFEIREIKRLVLDVLETE
jgi:DNA-binding NtrC family response regulator